MKIDYEGIGNKHSVICYCPKCNQVFSDMEIEQYMFVSSLKKYMEDNDFPDIPCPACDTNMELLDRKICSTVMTLNNIDSIKTVNCCEGHMWISKEDNQVNSIDPYVDFEIVQGKNKFISESIIIAEIIKATDGKEFDVRYYNERVKEDDLTWKPCRRFVIYPNFKFFNFENTDGIIPRFNAVCEKFRKEIGEFANELYKKLGNL